MKGILVIDLYHLLQGRHAGQGADIFAGRFEGLLAVEVEPDWLWTRMTQDQEFAARFEPLPPRLYLAEVVHDILV